MQTYYLWEELDIHNADKVTGYLLCHASSAPGRGAFRIHSVFRTSKWLTALEKAWDILGKGPYQPLHEWVWTHDEGPYVVYCTWCQCKKEGASPRCGRRLGAKRFPYTEDYMLDDNGYIPIDRQ